MKKIIFTFVIFFSLLFLSKSAVAVEKVDVYFFYGQGCPHCAAEEPLLAQLEKDNSNLAIHRYETFSNSDNANLLTCIGEKMKIDTSGVPVTIVGSKHFLGYRDAETSGQNIKNAINDCLAVNCSDNVVSVIKQYKQDQKTKATQIPVNETQSTFPIKNFVIISLIVIFVLIGFFTFARKAR